VHDGFSARVSETMTRLIELYSVLLWGLLGLAGAIALVWEGLSILRRRRDSKRKVCTYCGYDLRATPERCPECGKRAEWFMW
jgi:hypothetical protein